MKATKAGMIIGTAISGLDSGQGEVLVFLHVGHWAPRDSALSVRGEGLAGVVIDALAQAERDGLRAEVAALRNENAALQERLGRLEAAIARLAPASGTGD